MPSNGCHRSFIILFTRGVETSFASFHRSTSETSRVGKLPSLASCCSFGQRREGIFGLKGRFGQARPKAWVYRQNGDLTLKRHSPHWRPDRLNGPFRAADGSTTFPRPSVASPPTAWADRTDLSGRKTPGKILHSVAFGATKRASPRVVEKWRNWPVT